ncbi:MAG: hypothetical protein Q9209_005975 [Squamulea sp. 1 TL-2023]
MSSSRTLSTVLALLTCLLLLSIPPFTQHSNKTTKRISTRQPSAKAEPATSLNPNDNRTIALNNVHQQLAASLRDLPSHKAYVKRVDLTYTQAKRRGDDFYTVYQNAFDCNKQPGIVFTQGQFDNAWSMTPPEPDDLLDHWKTALSDTTGKLPSPSAIKAIEVVQNKAPFTSAQGAQVMEPTDAQSYVQYIPSAGAILVLHSQSADDLLAKRGVAKADRSRGIPTLNRLSDVLWYMWNTVTNEPNSLRYIGREGIINTATKTIVDEIFVKAVGTIMVPWPGISYGLNTDEGKALLGTPNGVAIAWMLIDRYRELGKREVRVRIWTVEGSRQMLWDMAPTQQ